MADLREISVPDHFWGVAEVAELDRVSDWEHSKLADEIDGLHNDIYILSATERGIAHWERILGITPQETETLEDRRARILWKRYHSNVLTESVLRARLNSICGEDGYTYSYDGETQYFHLDVTGKDYGIVKQIIQFLEYALSLKIIFEVENNAEFAEDISLYRGAATYTKYILNAPLTATL